MALQSDGSVELGGVADKGLRLEIYGLRLRHPVVLENHSIR